MATNSLDKPMEGVVEVDECYVGGKPRYSQEGVTGRGTKKQPVVALVQRDGMAICGPVERVNIESLRGAIVDFIDRKAVVCTDDLHLYRNIPQDLRAVNHTRKEYVRKDPDGLLAHTNTVESYFALIKRGHYGVYHSMSKGHLHLYCAEFGFRWNQRKVSDSERRDAAYKRAPGKRLKYKTAAKSA